ncbi:MAG: thioredoxin domain-containing protein [Kofleriaceae bacterium]
MQPGSTIAGKFRVERVLGQGGMGIVVVATHLQLEQTVALKFLHADIVSSPEVMERLMREARASAKLKSEHACRVMDVGLLDSGAPYIVMELLDGQDLSALIRRGVLAPAHAAELVLQAAVAIAEAHAAGIVHRDLKPSNLFVTERLDGSQLVKVLDFGIAKAAKADTQLTRTTAIMGSPGYMSPEQLRSSKVVDQRTDIWALGVVLYEAVSGVLPFRADTITELAVKVAMDEPEPLHTEAAYAAVVARCLQKRPEDRYQSIADLADALAPIAGVRAATSAAMIARLSGRQPAVSAPPPTVQAPVPHYAAAAASHPGFPAQYPPPPPPMHFVPAQTPMGERKPSSNVWLFGGLGALVAVVGVIALIALTRGPGDDEPIRRDSTEEAPGKPRVIAEVPGRGSATALPDDTEEALRFLDDVYAQQNGGKKGTRDEALQFLDKAYAQQAAQTNDKPDPDAVFGVDLTAAIAAGQLEGATSAPVTIVMAFDFACPYCVKAAPVVSELVGQYAGKVRAIYLNYVVHPQQVTVAHQYGCAAAKQGKFVPFMHGFETGPFAKYASTRDATALAEPAILALASQLGLDVGKLRADAKATECTDRIQADMTELQKFKVTGTPAFFINGAFIGGAIPKAEMEAIVVKKLALADASGVASGQYYQQEIFGKGVHAFKSKNANTPPTRADAIKFLVDMHRQQKQQAAAKDAMDPDPDAMFAVDIAPAVAARQVLGGPAPVTIVVASDFACPYCRKLDPTLRELYTEYAGKVRLVFMHMVVHAATATTGHQYACAAAKQGKYAAFTEQFWIHSFDVYAASAGKDTSVMTESRILAYAGQAGLATGKLKDDANGAECKARIAADMAELAKFKVNGTPTLFINGTIVGGALPKDQLKQKIDAALATATGSDYYDRVVFATGLHQFRSKADAKKPRQP